MQLIISERLREFLDPGLALVLLLTLFHIVPLAGISGLSDVNAFGGSQALTMVSLLACGGGMYLFCRRRNGRLGALLAGLLYSYSPYLMVSQAYTRGALAELPAFALFPLLLWQVDALRDRPKPLNFAAVSLLQFTLFSAHRGTAPTLTGIAVAWVAFETAVQYVNREASQIKPWAGLLALFALLLGIFGAAILWLPALLELGAAPMENLNVDATLDYASDYVPLYDLLSSARIPDAGAINGLRQAPILGIAQWVAALAGALGGAALYIGGYRTRHPQTLLGAAFFGILSLALIFSLTPSSAGFWADLRPLRISPDPSRVLGLLAGCLAIVASVNGLWLESLQQRFQVGIIALAIALPIATSIPLLYIPEWQIAPLHSSIGAASDETVPRAGQNPPAHDIAAWLSAASIVMLILALGRLRYQDQTARPYWTSAALSRNSLIGIALGGGIALLTFGFTFREGIAWIHSPPGEALPAQVRLKFTVERSLQLLGFDLRRERWRAGETLMVNAYWHALDETKVDFFSILVLSDGGRPIAQSNGQRPGGQAVEDWRRQDGYVIDSYALLLPLDLPAGDYDLMLELANCERQPIAECGGSDAPEVRDAQSQLTGASIALASIRVDAG